MELKIVEGKFEPNRRNINIGITVVIMASVLCFFLQFLVGPWSIVCLGPLIGTYAYVIYSNNAVKYQVLVLTNLRVYGKVKKKEVNLPIDSVTHVELNHKNCIIITTPSGVIGFPCCTNGEEVYSAIVNVLNLRTAQRIGLS